ncbi:midcut-by-XrtH protein [Paracidovorax avenae]|uniref:midcut-by-XrtH protein n=1 Tax=Paracidovorax avenae TaxID=80867 RepID=UPI001CEF95BF|nr:midcut-by-XrtH protein [Paracidovorax avenae]
MRTVDRAIGSWAAVCMGLACTRAMAEPVPPVTVTYAPPAAMPVPTLSQWGLILLTLALLVLVYRTLRKASHGRPIAWALLAGALALSMGGVGGWIGKSFAAPGARQLSLPAGGSVQVSSGLYILTNTSGVSQQIINIDVPSVYTRLSIDGQFPAECSVGAVLAPNAACSTHFNLE